MSYAITILDGMGIQIYKWGWKVNKILITITRLWQLHKLQCERVKCVCCTPKFALSFLKGPSWTLRFASVKFQVSDYNFPRKSFTREKWSKSHWKVKLWLFDQNQISIIIFHQDMKLVHQNQKSEITLKKKF